MQRQGIPYSMRNWGCGRIMVSVKFGINSRELNVLPVAEVTKQGKPPSSRGCDHVVAAHPTSCMPSSFQHDDGVRKGSPGQHNTSTILPTSWSLRPKLHGTVGPSSDADNLSSSRLPSQDENFLKGCTMREAGIRSHDSPPSLHLPILLRYSLGLAFDLEHLDGETAD